MGVEEFVNKLMKEIVRILQSASKPIGPSFIESELLNIGFPKIVPSINSPLLQVVKNYIKRMVSTIVNELPDGNYIYIPLYFPDDLEELTKYTEELAGTDFESIWDSHLSSIKEILITESDIQQWADDNELNTDPDIRFMSFMAQFSILLSEELPELEYVHKEEKLIKKTLSDNNFRIVCLGILTSEDTLNPEIIRKLCELLGDQNYAGLIGMQRYRHSKILKKFHKLAISSDDSEMLIGITGLKNSDNIESLPFLLNSLEQIEVEKKLAKKYDDLVTELSEHSIKVARRQGRLPEKIKNKLIKLCHSDNMSIQTLALKCMESKWLKSDIPEIEKIPEKNNPLAAKAKLRALYKKKAESRLKYAREMLDHDQEGFRNIAIEALGEIGGEKEIKLLNKLGKLDLIKYDAPRLIEAINKIRERLKEKKKN